MIATVVGMNVPEKLVGNFFDKLVNGFFKILPIREKGEDSLPIYMRSLQTEVLGCGELIHCLNEDARFLRLASTLQYLIDHPECDVQTVKREVFKSIRICEQLSKKYDGCDAK